MCTGTPSALPGLFRRPLLKSDKAPPLAVGVQSGRRSALIKTDGKWYRLKGISYHKRATLVRFYDSGVCWPTGCGDLCDGFPLRRVPDRPDECFEIRVRERYGSSVSHMD